jgi:hypothetical protein
MKIEVKESNWQGFAMMEIRHIKGHNEGYIGQFQNYLGHKVYDMW